MEVVKKAGPDVLCKVVDPGIILSRANLTVRRNGKILRGRNASLPILTAKVCLHRSAVLQPYKTAYDSVTE